MERSTYFLITAIIVVAVNCSASTPQEINVPPIVQSPSNILQNNSTRLESSAHQPSEHELRKTSSASQPSEYELRMTSSESQPSEHELKFTSHPRSSIWIQRQKKMAEWLDHLFSEYPARKDKTTEAKSRGRLLNMAPKFEDRIVGNKKEDVTSFRRVSKSMLSRMPMSFGKRALTVSTDDVDHIVRNGFTQGNDQLIQDGIDFSGIKENLKEKEDKFTRKRKDKIGRMPMAFGKRQQEELSSQHDENMRRLIPAEELSSQHHENMRRLIPAEELSSQHHENIRILIPDEEISSQHDENTRRSIPAEELSSGQDEDNRKLISAESTEDYETSDPQYGCEPDACSSFDGRVVITNDVALKRDSAETNKNNQIEANVKEINENTDSKLKQNNEINENTDSTLKQNILLGHHLTFNNDIQKDNHNDEVQAHYPEMSKETSNIYFDSDEDNQANEDDDEDNNNILEIEESRLSANRVPMFYDSKTNSNKLKLTSITDTLTKTECVPSTLQKKNDQDKYHALFQILKSKFHAIKDSTNQSSNRKRQHLLDQLLSDGALTRLTRSKLERMPITFGKRDNNAFGLTCYPNNGQKIIKLPITNNIPTTFDKTSDNPSDEQAIMKRPILNKMPLAYGKRLANTFGITRVIKRPRLDKMPLAFGKRNNYFSSNFREIIKRPRLDKMPLAFGKRNNYFSSNFREIIKRPRLDKMPLAFGKRNHYFSNNIQEIIKRPRLSKMPLAFGKRTHPIFYSVPHEELNRANVLKSTATTNGERHRSSGNIPSGNNDEASLHQSSWVVSSSGTGADGGRQPSLRSMTDQIE